MSDTNQPFVDIRNLTVTFTGGRKPVHAVGGVDLQVQRGEVVALIGESGSGKSVTLRSLLRLHAPRHAKMGGQMLVGGQDVLSLAPSALAQYRGKVASMIFQEPLLALDPVARARQRRSCPPTRLAVVRACAYPKPRASARRLPARDERWHAPARDDCPGPGLSASVAVG